MARIPEETIEEIRKKTDIVDLIGEYIQLTKRGKNWFGLCPFHGENTPSFSVSEDKQLFHCFGCGASGNAITFVMDLESRTFSETIIKLAERVGVGIDVIPVSGSGHTNQQEFKQMMDAHALATNFYSHILLNTVEGEKALEYLEKRGFTRASIEKYGIGWALDDFEALSGLLKRKGFNMQEMERSGLCIMKDDGTGYFDRFRGRIMFPLWDDTGNVIAFSGRSLYEDKEVAKYLNSPETPIFEKSKILYNLHNARLNIRKTGKVILFEGFMDTISADHVDVGNSVAIMGTSLSETHLLKLKRIAKELIICCDGDHAGWEAAKRFASIANANGMNIRIALLPNDMDPDEFIQKYGGEAFRDQIIGNPHSYMSFIMAYAKRSKNLSYENDVLQFIHEVLEELALRSSPVERDLYIRQLSEETNVSVEAINQQFIKMAGNRARQAKADSMSPAVVENKSTTPVPKARQKTGTERAERLLLHHLLNDGSLFDRFKEEKREVFFHEDYATIFVRLAGFYEQYKKPDFHRFAESIDDRELRKLVLEAAMLESDSDNAEKEIEDCIIHLEKKRIEISIQEKMHESKEAERVNNHTRALELAREIIQLRNSLAAL
ncbi:DNA primase [Sporosarcina pasteurii]|uniref:DNA primase n=1 Tax=Sporosarcina pasteurii TaxID=1474 RepID=A0A380BQC0_SPOPA|nr:DNA primase [Sporosarcina pasteurii]MDS9471039.1 DNA primase [Sporosarcina pasteurii]QBQ05315.1 DNA primase [Sporosarcina pasteurii]SUJ04097.1 DNA primase [Sporosarcina pasteurii]